MARGPSTCLDPQKAPSLLSLCSGLRPWPPEVAAAAADGSHLWSTYYRPNLQILFFHKAHISLLLSLLSVVTNSVLILQMKKLRLGKKLV